MSSGRSRRIRASEERGPRKLSGEAAGGASCGPRRAEGLGHPAGDAAVPASRRRRVLLDGLGLAVWAAALLWAAPRLAPVLASAPPQAVAVGALAGLLAADLVSGVVHWVGDTFFEPETPWLGPWLVAPFREHHRDPTAIVGHGVVEVAGTSALAASPLLVLAGAAAFPGGSLGAAAAAFLLGVGLAIAATNPIHRWAHAPRPPAPVRGLQRVGLILGPSHHARHHAGDHRRAFCVTTGWLNPLLDRTRTFDRLERRLRRWHGLRRLRPS